MSLCQKEKFIQAINLKIMKSLYYGRQCDHKTLKRAIPDLYYVPSKLSISKFSIKSYETLRISVNISFAKM